MKAILLGGGGFLGTNLVRVLGDECLTVVDGETEHLKRIEAFGRPEVRCVESSMEETSDFDSLIAGHDVLYHLISTTIPATSNRRIGEELKSNVVLTANLLDACARQGLQKVVFVSSGGTVYGSEARCPISEDAKTDPITSYGVQKIAIEKLLYLYRYIYGLDYRIVRLSNPYGPYQIPNGVLGAVSTFVYKALRNEEIVVYGDGSIVRDFIYVEDAMQGIRNVVNGDCEYRTFNIGSGCGTSIRELVDMVSQVLDMKLKVRYTNARRSDVPVNYLDISRYESVYGQLCHTSLSEGIIKTAEFMRAEYGIHVS